MKRLCRDTIWQVTIHCKTQWFLNVEAESPQYTRWSWLPAGRVASSKWEKIGCWHFSGRCWFWHCASQDPLKNTMDYGLRVRILCVFQWILKSPSSHIHFGLQANFLFVFKICWMSGADRLVLVVNDECLSDSALRGGQVWVFFQISLHLSAEMADLQNVDYLSMFCRLFFG